MGCTPNFRSPAGPQRSSTEHVVSAPAGGASSAPPLRSLALPISVAGSDPRCLWEGHATHWALTMCQASLSLLF